MTSLKGRNQQSKFDFVKSYIADLGSQCYYAL